jgi:nucleoside-diphosphate-sugar epimerase
MSIKKIILFGSTGMLGSNILDDIRSNKYEFLYPSRQQVDLLDKESVFKYIDKIKPDLIINVAGMVGGIIKNSNNNYEFLINNSYINLNLIDAAYSIGIQNFLNVSSSCIYPKNFETKINEDDILTGPLEPTNEGYAISKILSLKMCSYISNFKNLNYKTLIPTNLYGPNDNFDPESSHMRPGVIRRVHESKKFNHDIVEIWGDGKARREFMYIKDLVDFIYFSIVNFDRIPLTLNVGMGVDYSINEYYKTIAEVVGYNGKFKHDLSKPVGMKRKLVDISKLEDLGWRSTTSLKEGVKKTYEFFLNNYSNEI